MTFEIKQFTPRTEEVLRGPHADCYDECRALEKLAKKLERELIACGHEQLTCCNCGARRNDTEDLTTDSDYDRGVMPLQHGTFQCPMCGQENNWRRISRFLTE